MRSTITQREPQSIELYTGSGSNHPLLQLYNIVVMVCRDVVVTSAEFASFSLRTSPSPSYALDSSHVVFRGVLWLKVRDCIFVDATGVIISFHFLPFW